MGAMTLSWSLDKVGPIARTVEDCALVLEAIRGPGGTDVSVIEAPFNYSAARDLSGLRIGYRRGRIPSSAITRLKGIAGATNTFKPIGCAES
jgi:Asp-tRNA(Asn)/Glu-tRNA(Gln) amidotransferase A subunit family amidase